jgi:two-component system, LytTR family, sensor kinase
MKANCESCGCALAPDREAYVCSYECTFCPICFSSMNALCSHCGGELVRRPRSRRHVRDGHHMTAEVNESFRPSIIWGLSFGVWTFIALAYTLTVYQLYRSTGMSGKFLSIFGLQCSQVLGYALVTPFVFGFANRYPVQRTNWGRRSLLLLAGGLIFSLAHVAIRGMTPYAFWDPRIRDWVSAVWDSQAHGFRIQWKIYKALFLTNAVDDIIGMYLPVVLLAYVASYYRRLRERELRTSQLQAQLGKARLQTLKSQLQPHFLFNTLNSISALMLTDVQAADRMITRLGDLLRTSLETAGTQMTTLRQELEFVNCYIEIEKIRFEERLSVQVDIAPETLDAIMPHLLLQPLVDNAIKHGISKLVAGGAIYISANADDLHLYLQVRDNGPGCRASGSPLRGVGLTITRERLETIYGEDQTLELVTTPGETVARISIPLQIAISDEQFEVSGITN